MWCAARPLQLHVLTENVPPLTKKIKSFQGIKNYLHKFSPVTAKLCAPLQGLTSAKADWAWDRMYQSLNEKAKAIIKDDVSLVDLGGLFGPRTPTPNMLVFLKQKSS